ncbi:MAG: hypothetical protein JWR26_2036 [Pedosphaera sp.]|nr:hypothetical protein [Pedosphaera sp.]
MPKSIKKTTVAKSKSNKAIPQAGCTIGYIQTSTELGEDSEAAKNFKKLIESVVKNFEIVSLPLLWSLRADIEVADMAILWKNYTAQQVKLGKWELVQGIYDSPCYRVL